MITLISFLFTVAYIALMTIFVSQIWWLIIIWIITGIIVFYVVTALQVVVAAYTFMPRTKVNSKLKHNFLRSLAWWMMIFLFNTRYEVVGAENVPMVGPLTIYANHKSKIDPVYVYQAIKRPHGYAAKSDLSKIGLFNRIISSMGAFYVYRDDNRATLKELQKGIKLAKEGHAIVIFPEGGTMYRQHQEIKHVRNGSFKISERAQTDILPITIHNSDKFAKRKIYFIPFKVTVEIHPIIKYKDVKDLHTNEVADLVITAINSSFK